MFSEKHFTKLVQRTLLAGVVLCLLLFFFGVLFRISGNPSAGGFFTAGVMALLLTPAARVAMLVYGFYKMRESLMALAAVTVLVLLLTAFLL